MVTTILFIFTAVSYFISIQGLKELPRIFSPTEVISSVIDQVAIDDSKLQEFLPIFHYFVNFTEVEKQSREEINNLTATDFIENDENQQLYGSYAWQDGNVLVWNPSTYQLVKTIIEALNEEDNVTGDLIETRYEDVVEYIKSFISKPENLKERYIQNLLDSENDEDEEVANETSTANENSYDANRTEDVNEFWDDTETRRIFKGNRTKIKEFPFIASVLIFNQFACAGSIISNDLIITAASCLQLLWNNRFFRENPAFLSVRIGSPFFKVGGELIPILEVYFHPSYVPKTLKNNLALMRLQRRIKFKRRRRSNVKKINFDRKASALSFHTPGITIIGWGAKIKSNLLGNAISNSLHMAVLDFYDLRSCREVYGDKFVTRTNFCAGFITKGQGACNHDVGDPGVVDGTLMGVTSFGSPVCGLEDTPTVFTKLGYYADWIDDIMDQEVPHMKVRTTLRYRSVTDSVQLLGIDSDEDKPVPPLRERLPQKPLSEKLGIEPLTAQDLEDAIVVREGHYSSSSHDGDEDTAKSSQEGENEDEGDIDISTMSPVLRMTKIFGHDTPKDSMSRDTDDKSENIEDGIRISKSFEMDDDKSGELSFDRVSTVIPDMNVVVPKDVSSESNLNTDEKENIVSAMQTKLESDHEVYATTEYNIDDHILNIKRDFTALDGKKDVTTTVDDDELNIRDEEGNQNKHTTTPNTVEDSGSIEVKSVEVKQDDGLRKQQDSQPINSIQNEQSHDEAPTEVSEDMIKKEIEKLIRELDVSIEQNADKLSEKSKSQDNLNNNNRDPSNERLTLLYVSDSEKKANFKTRSEESDNDGLSIDPKPFQEDTKRLNDDLISDLVGEKEVFEIFAEEIHKMVNKTLI